MKTCRVVQKMMRQQYQVPSQQLSCWRRLFLLYRDYLPELQMEADSFTATAREAAAIFQELSEMERPNPNASALRASSAAC